MIFFILLILWIACGFYCLVVAESKGHNGPAWLFGGFFFGFFALIAVAGLPDRKLRKYIRQIGEKQNAIVPEVDLNNRSNEKPQGEVIINGVKQEN